MADWPGPDDALAPSAFEDLYEGALALEDDTQRLQAATLVLLLGRLGLSLPTALHVHPDWIRWDEGTLSIPSKDPCACGLCWDTARDRRDYDEPALDVLYEECYSPPGDRAPRDVPVDWSPRTAGALATVGDRWGVLDLTPDAARAAIDAAADAAGLDGVTPDRLVATAVAFHADVGVGRRETARLLGVETDRVAPYWTDEPAARLARLTGGHPAATYPVACANRAYDGEPFEPAEHPDGPDGSPGVPRETALPEAVDYDADAHRDAGPPTRVDRPDPGGAVSGGEGEALPDPGDIDVPTMADTGAIEDVADAPAGGATAEAASADAAHPAEGTSPDAPEPASPPAAGSVPREAAGAAPSADAGTPDATESAGPSGPRDVVSAPVVADVSTRVAADGLGGGRALDARVVLGQQELYVTERDGDGHLLVPLDTVWDVKIDEVPSRLAATFPRCVTVHHRPEGTDEHAVAIQLPPQQRHDLASALYRLLLNVTPVTLIDPDRVAGRVIDAEPARRVLYVRPETIAFTDPGGDEVVCSFALSDVADVERTARTIDGESRPVIALRRVTDNRPVTTVITTEDRRLLRLCWRYVRREYRDTLADVRELRLSDPEKMILVALYSTETTPDLSAILEFTDQELEAALQSLSAKELIREPAATTELTGRGQLAVSDRLDAVNE